MRLSVSTSGIVHGENLYNDLKMIKDAGFEGIDLSFASVCPHGGSLEGYHNSIFAKPTEEIVDFYREYAKICSGLGLEIVQSHAPWPCYFKGNDAVNEFLRKALEKCIIAASEVGCRYMVVHPYWSEDKDIRESMEINYKLFSGLTDAAKKHNVVICIENLFAFRGGRLIDEPFANSEIAKNFVDRLNREAGCEVFGFCLDIGHANALAKNLYEFFRNMGNRIKVLHIHENNGISDQHMIPYTSFDFWGANTTIDWADVVDGIVDTSYKGDLNLEVATDAIPKELVPHYLTFAAEVDRYLRKRISDKTDASISR